MKNDAYSASGRDQFGRTQAEIIAYLADQLNEHYAEGERATWFDENGQEHDEPNAELGYSGENEDD